MSEENPTKVIKMKEDKPVQTPAPAQPAPEQKPQMPLNPKPEDLPPEAEPAMESAGDDEQRSDLLGELAPQAEDTGTSETDTVLEGLRKAKDERNIDAPAEDSELDLETNQVALGPGRGDELVELLMRLYPSTQSYNEAKADPDSPLNHLINAIDHGWGTTQNEDIRECLKTIKNLRLHDQQDKERFPGIKDGRPSRITHKTVDMAGHDAIIAIKARLGGIIRVNLLNSGFWVALRSPELSELQEIFSTIDFEAKNIGRIMGGHFALVTDMYLKRKFCELLIKKQIIFESNLKDIYKTGVFIRNLAYHDYDTLVHGVVMLMTKGGLRYRCICPKCGHDSIENLDIGACKFVNEDLWTDEVRTWWNTTVTSEGKLIIHTEKDLAHYRNDIIRKTAEFENVIDNGLGEKITMKLEIGEPTMQKYFDVGSKLITELNKTIDNISTGEDDKADLVRSTLAVHNNQLMAPWVNSVQLINADGNVELRASDVDSILSYLDDLSQHDKRLVDTLTKYIADSRFNWIGTHSIKCPSCGTRPSATMDNFYPLEIQTIFFGLSSRLWQAGR